MLVCDKDLVSVKTIIWVSEEQSGIWSLVLIPHPFRSVWSALLLGDLQELTTSSQGVSGEGVTSLFFIIVPDSD